VTGVAGFIGSSLAERLLADGHEVVGLDCFVPYYARELKDSNLRACLRHPSFTFIEADIVEAFDMSAPDGAKRVSSLLDATAVVFHEAAQAGVRASWGASFDIYCHNNILGTQKLLEACRGREGLRVVYASSSSVYGETSKFPMEEDDLPAPLSPYGVSKLAAEHLMRLYTANFGVHTVSLRYFTVYGPRQRPDMAFHRLCREVLVGGQFRVFGTGEQTRDFTFIDDIVQANIDAAQHGAPGGVYNLGGGTRISMNDVIRLLEKVAGRPANIVRERREKGDVSHTGASVKRAQDAWGFRPRVSLEEGLARELEYVRQVVLPLVP
jgi:nucleoside-diphosphate-sugar epimerase